MKKNIVFCGSKKVGLECFNWLLGNNYPVKYFITGEEHYRKYFNSILSNYSKKKIKEIDHNELEKKIIDGEIDFDWIVLSINYRNLFSREVCSKTDIINLHLGLIQNFRGCHSPTHAIIEGKNITGCTLHRVVPKIDSGEIIAQKEIPIYKTDTGFDVFHRDIDAAIQLFMENFPKYYREELKGIKPSKLGKYKKYKEILNKEIKFETMDGKEIYDFIRAHIFPGFDYPYFYIGDKKFIIKEENEKQDESTHFTSRFTTES